MHGPEVKFPQRFLRLVIGAPTFAKAHDQSENLRGTTRQDAGQSSAERIHPRDRQWSGFDVHYP
jgi:hypothetical protein